MMVLGRYLMAEYLDPQGMRLKKESLLSTRGCNRQMLLKTPRVQVPKQEMPTANPKHDSL